MTPMRDADAFGAAPNRSGASPPVNGSARDPSPLPEVEKPAAVRRLAPVDAGALAAQVNRLSERAWQLGDSVKENRFPCFHHTRHLIFRFIEGNRDPRRFYSLPGWLVWRPLLLPLMTRAAAPYGLAEPVFPKAMLARLAAGRGIDAHVDGSPGGSDSNAFVHKIHVPLDTNPDAVMTVAGESFHLAAGYAWEVNNNVPHGAFNGGSEDRIHFIFEVFDGAGQRIEEEGPELAAVGSAARPESALPQPAGIP